MLGRRKMIALRGESISLKWTNLLAMHRTEFNRLNGTNVFGCKIFDGGWKFHLKQHRYRWKLQSIAERSLSHTSSIHLNLLVYCVAKWQGDYFQNSFIFLWMFWNCLSFNWIRLAATFHVDKWGKTSHTPASVGRRIDEVCGRTIDSNDDKDLTIPPAAAVQDHVTIKSFIVASPLVSFYIQWLRALI